MRIALIADAYPPLRSSAAVQLRDLAVEFAHQGHDITVLVPSSDLLEPWSIELDQGVQVLRVASLRTKDVGHVKRGIGEMLMPVALALGIRKSPIAGVKWDAVVWYSPSIFFGPLIAYLKRTTGCRSYLILRDIFPEWAVDVGVMRRGLAYRFFKFIESYQYSVADTIGVQSPSNLAYLEKLAKGPSRQLEVLQNWLSDAPDLGSSICVAEGFLSGRTIFVYAGNMGVAQGVDVVLDLAERLKGRSDIGFLLVGRGSDADRLQDSAQRRSLDNVVFYDEVHSSEIPGLLAQCHVGLVTLDPRHSTHNVPGKFVAYMQAGLPVLARVNAGNDLADLINVKGVGRVYVGESLEAIQHLAENLCADRAERKRMSLRARQLFRGTFSTRIAVRQITTAVERGFPH